MSRKDNGWDAVAARFFATLKVERVPESLFRTRVQAAAAIRKSSEVFYNRMRRHALLGYLSPRDVERCHDPLTLQLKPGVH